MFSLGLILAELLLLHPDPPPAVTRSRQSSFPTSPPQSHSPPPLHSVPLLSTFTTNRRAFIEQMTRLFGPLPPIYHAAKFWNNDYAKFDVGSSLSSRMESDGVDPALTDFIMRMVELDPVRRLSAREALRHEWIVGPMLGYWAVVGVEWTQPEVRDPMWQRLENQNGLSDNIRLDTSLESSPKDVAAAQEPVDPVKRDVSVESASSTPEEGHASPESARKQPPFYDFSAMRDSDEEDIDEVSQVLYSGSSPTKLLPFIDSKPPPTLTIEEPEMVSPAQHN
jgi:serine/threonine protein kinase